MRSLILSGLFISLISCSNSPPVLKTGAWRGVIGLQGQELPFNFEIKKSDTRFTVFLRNGTEKLVLDEVTISGDSVRIILHIFDAELRARIYDGKLEGIFVKNYVSDSRLPFRATWGENYRFADFKDQAAADFAGKFAVHFFFEKDTTVSVGIFRQKGNSVEGTFLNPDGDYRYLEGSVIDGKLWLSTFDGHHAYLFSAIKTDENTLEGDYWSGKSHHETWRGTRNDQAVLPDMESFTFLKKGYDKLEFSFPDVNGDKISSTDAKYRGKVLIVQLFGSWCPNCMDETKFLSRWYNKNHDRGVEILGLAYEQKADFDYARGRVQKMKAKLGVNYDFAIAGTSDKVEASKTLPALNRVFAFPTTIFIGKDGKVKHIHSGFSGPGTGPYYDEYVQRFNETVNELLSDNFDSKSRN